MIVHFQRVVWRFLGISLFYWSLLIWLYNRNSDTQLAISKDVIMAKDVNESSLSFESLQYKYCIYRYVRQIA